MLNKNSSLLDESSRLRSNLPHHSKAVTQFHFLVSFWPCHELWSTLQLPLCLSVVCHWHRQCKTCPSGALGQCCAPCRRLGPRRLSPLATPARSRSTPLQSTADTNVVHNRTPKDYLMIVTVRVVLCFQLQLYCAITKHNHKTVPKFYLHKYYCKF